ncbi:hypothetical protein Lbys_1692 [Leadbetterella byssophila DSM 17132]|uniref:Outer membrane protein beta-barrel domain-containing protein n=1 Tax=Leadbetterella byssophila (strain DSM 17132 / JCM 16389 / KACC 11308 / NBRC 106382 / 4M15) TaxID=649349 RepID=E4RZH5_LEAB4|nr:hypothetical protein [Leadbetterella byssophila]ADQ17399.1 hypothetical protein Lbys_1692 [Leadbetterella byssophila DSM 17132]
MKFPLILCALFFSLKCIAQEEEYYKDFSHRKVSHEIENLPNLESKFTTFYVGASGALRKSYNGESSGFENFGMNHTSFKGWLEGIIGFNLNNTYFFETGIVQTKNNFSSRVYSTPDYPGFGIGMNSTQLYLPVTVKRKVLNLNRVTNNAYVNLGLGAGFLVHSNPKAFGEFQTDVNEEIQSQSLSHFYVTLNHSRSPIYGEVIAELKGNITERLEILVFFKGIFRKPDYLSHQFSVEYLGGRYPLNFKVSENMGSLVFGIQGRWNSRKFYSYKSRI